MPGFPLRLRSLPLSIVLSAIMFGSSCAGLNASDIFDLTDDSAPLTEKTVVDGLKEALRVGTERTSQSLSSKGGFSENALLRIPLPKELDTVTSALRTIGMGSRVDSFETMMNRAAENAAGESVDVFVSAIRSMSISDAFTILNGPENAATEFFRERTAADLKIRFTPVVNSVMDRVGVYQQYQDVVRIYNSIPLSKPVSLDLTEYITDLTLAGLFTTLAGEEKKIREDPLARTTALLQRVFG